MPADNREVTIVVNVSGGVVQHVVADRPVRVIVVDYGIDDALIADLPTIVARTGDVDKAAVSILQADTDEPYMQSIVKVVASM